MFEQGQQKIIRVTSDGNGLAIIVSDDPARANEWFLDALNGAPSRLRLERVGGSFLGLVPGGRETRVGFSEFVDTGSACSSYFYRSCHIASGSEGF
jgi:hypothetical protein